MFFWLLCCSPPGAAHPRKHYPDKPIRLLVPFAPGGVVDTSARILTNKLTERLGWQFVVDNRPGGNGFIAVTTAARGQPDGYTLLVAHTGEFAVNPAIFKDVPYELDRDFTPITMLSDAPMLVVVGSQSPIQNWKDLIAMAKAKPGQVSYGSPGQRLGQSPRDRMARVRRRHQAESHSLQGRRAGRGRRGGR